MKVAHELNMSDTRLNNFFHTSQYWKINIPTSILLKTGPLTTAEKNHKYSLESYKMINDIFGKEIGFTVPWTEQRLRLPISILIVSTLWSSLKKIKLSNWHHDKITLCLMCKLNKPLK